MENVRIKAIIAAIITIIIILSTYVLIYYFGTDPNGNRIIYNTRYTKQELLTNTNISLENKNNTCIEYLDIGGVVNVFETEYNLCSLTRPNYCKDGTMISNCMLCGCDIYESCGSNGECEANAGGAFGAGGGGLAGASSEGGEGGAAAGGSVGVGEETTTNSCTDSDISAIPSPVFTSGSCQDTIRSYNDKCQDPITSAESTTWVKEYKCQISDNISICVGVFKSCPSSAEIYFGTSDSQCSSNRCLTPIIQLPNATETCSDGIKNQDETNIDCGGTCGGYFYDDSCHTLPEQINATCFDNIKNQDETGIDCGGVCGGYFYDNSCHETPQEIISETCSDGIKNQDETDIDCGGTCSPCLLEEGDGGSEGESCYVSPVDSSGLTIFEASTCYDSTGSYDNSCTSPLGGETSDVFIRTYVCIDSKCTPKYYSCPIKGEDNYNSEDYKCVNNKCTI